ncbi:ATP-binding cassette domain-containing protein [Thalassotalea sp. 1_MG-2023]|uniref:ABC transporter ATP-binding protein n=1 Tax=Thalassotalea sp. 1_MG-2023 TaxID=3062680 RepID=UPI0026E3BB9F|nr:ATP-binding cassette domain-containing protein [Thalassotalea sp. 1_MG-2023]MDO6425761.1 ATP-binding cassette domain-containing protein [Thalassotalea sp. 1_MG-2023]
MQLLVNQVLKQYATVKAVNHLSFNVNHGEIFALLGPNGAGKSSLVKMLTGFTKPDAGKISVTIDDVEYDAIPNWALGYLPEDRGLYPEKSVIDNICYFAQLNGMTKSEAKEQAAFWLEKFDLSERKSDQLKSLSKGNQQKVQLISAVIHRPQWIILDEPFSGLDPVNQEKVVTFLHELKKLGMTVLLSAHQMAMVEKIADRILLMNKGEAVFYGTLGEITQQLGSNNLVVASYVHAIDQEKITELFPNDDVVQINNTKLQVVCAEKDQLNQVTDKLTKLGALSSIQCQQRDLHQIYIDAIEQHGETSHEA